MSIVFFGTPEFGAAILEKLAEGGYRPALVVTVPDKPAGRKQLLAPPPVKTKAEHYGIALLQSEDRSVIAEQVRKEDPDLILLASFGVLLPKEILAIPKHGALNVHPSLLPKFRGPSPVQSAILEGEEITGVSIMLMDEKMDHGPILEQREVPIGTLTAQELKLRLAEAGGRLLLETIPRWIAGTITPREQEHEQATYTRTFTREDGRIDWQNPALYIERQIRAFTPWPGTYTFFQDKRLKVLKGQARAQGKEGAAPGTVYSSDGELLCQCGEGALLLQELQLEGGKPVSAPDFLLGHRDVAKAVLQ